MIIVNTFISALTIGLCTWIAKKKPELAGFLMSMPLSTLLILFLTQFQYQDDEKSILLAKSISIAIPATLSFSRFLVRILEREEKGVKCDMHSRFAKRLLQMWGYEPIFNWRVCSERESRKLPDFLLSHDDVPFFLSVHTFPPFSSDVKKPFSLC